MGLFAIILTLLMLAIGSLIPAFVVKLLMQTVFGRRVSLGIVFIVTIIGMIFVSAAYFGLMYYSEGTLDMRALPRFAASISPGENALFYLFGFMLQLVLFTFAVPDETMQLISGWKWAVVMVLQYIIFFAIFFAIAFATAGAGNTAETPQILTRVV